MLNNCPIVRKKNNPTRGNRQSQSKNNYDAVQTIWIYTCIYVCIRKSTDGYIQHKAITKVSMNNYDALFEYSSDD
jgi:hypothetical protein